MICTRAGDNQCTVAYANLVGANDGLIFDGGGFVAQNGRLVLDGAALPRGLRRRRPSTSIAPRRLRTREHHLAHRSGDASPRGVAQQSQSTSP